MEDNYSLHENKNIERAKNDKEYLGELLIKNEDLIWFSIRNYVGDPIRIASYNNMEKDDIQQIGRIGFIVAVNNFDSEKGVSFTTYAPTVIAGEIKAYLREKGRLLRLTRSAYDLYTKLSNYLKDVTYDKHVPVETIANELGVSVEEVEKVLSVGVEPIRMPMRENNQDESNEINSVLYTPIIDEDTHVEDAAIEDLYLDQLLDIVRSKLNERDKRILNAKLKGLTHAEIAEKEDIAKITVTRTMNKVREIIKNIFKEE